jgi:hypothetical protein
MMTMTISSVFEVRERHGAPGDSYFFGIACSKRDKTIKTTAAPHQNMSTIPESDDTTPGAFFTVASADGEYFADALKHDVIISAARPDEDDGDEGAKARNILFGFDSPEKNSTLRLQEHGNNVAIERLTVSTDTKIRGNLGVGFEDDTNDDVIAARLHVRGPEMRLTGGGDTRYMAHTDNLTGAAAFVCVGSSVLEDTSNTVEFGCSPSRQAFVRYNGKDRVTVDRQGRVGIGTSSPTHDLHVAGNGHVTGALSCSNVRVDGGSLSLDTNDPALQVIGTRSRPNKSIARFVSKDAEEGQYSEERAVLTVMGSAGGRVGINTASPEHALDVIGGDVFTTGQYLMSSDARLKRDIRVIRGAMQKVNALSGYTFRRVAASSSSNGGGDHENDQNRCAGFLAQELMTVLPEAVRQDEDEKGETMMSVSYGDVSALLLEALKEVSAKVDALEARLSP